MSGFFSELKIIHISNSILYHDKANPMQSKLAFTQYVNIQGGSSKTYCKALQGGKQLFGKSDKQTYSTLLADSNSSIYSTDK